MSSNTFVKAQKEVINDAIKELVDSSVFLGITSYDPPPPVVLGLDDPSNATLSSTIVLGTVASSSYVPDRVFHTDNYLFIGDWDTTGNTTYYKVYDTQTNPLVPSYVGTFYPPTGANFNGGYTLHDEGDYFYYTLNNGLYRFVWNSTTNTADIVDSITTTELANVATARIFKWRTNYLVLAGNTNSTLSIIDVSDPSNMSVAYSSQSLIYGNSFSAAIVTNDWLIWNRGKRFSSAKIGALIDGGTFTQTITSSDMSPSLQSSGSNFGYLHTVGTDNIYYWGGLNGVYKAKLFADDAVGGPISTNAAAVFASTPVSSPGTGSFSVPDIQGDDNYLYYHTTSSSLRYLIIHELSGATTWGTTLLNGAGNSNYAPDLGFGRSPSLSATFARGRNTVYLIGVDTNPNPDQVQLKVITS